MLNVGDLAAWLKVEKSWIYSNAGKELPGIKIGKYWRFERSTVEAWLVERTKSDTRG